MDIAVVLQEFGGGQEKGLFFLFTDRPKVSLFFQPPEEGSFGQGQLITGQGVRD